MQDSKCEPQDRKTAAILHFAFCILHYRILYETDIPSPDGETIVVKSDG